VEFYPVSCHASSRRRFLRGGIGLSAFLLSGFPARAAAAPGDGGAVIQKYARVEDDPWSIVHGVRAMGWEFALRDGRRAVGYVLSKHLEERSVGGQRYLAFPLTVEVHTNMFLKTFLEAGVPMVYSFEFQKRRRTLEDVVTGARALFRFSPATDRNDVAWSIIALTRATSPSAAEWVNAWGERIRFDEVVEDAFVTMERASGPIGEAMDRKTPLERQAPIHAFTCGGTHLLYSLLTAAHQGYTDRDRLNRVRRQMDILVYRLSADVDLMGRFYGEKAKQNPQVGWFHLDAILKFLGHAFECLAFAERQRLYRVPPAQAQRRERAAKLLAAALRQVEETDLDTIKAKHSSLYQQFVGDTCHAYHGLHLKAT
jgi:hypothetical protein